MPDEIASLAKLETRVLGIEEQVGGLAKNIDRFVDKVDQRFDRIAEDVKDRFDGLARRQDAGRTPIWHVICGAGGICSLLLSFVVVIGTMAFSPVNEKLRDHAEDIKALQRDTETHAELAKDFKAIDDKVGVNAKNIESKADAKLVDKTIEAWTARVVLLEAGAGAMRNELAAKSDLVNLNERFSTLSNRFNDFQGKLIAVPRDPVLGAR